MKFLLALLAVVGAGLLWAPTVTRSVRTRVARASQTLHHAEDRVVDTLRTLGEELIDRLPTDPVALPPAPPVTIFRQETASGDPGILLPDEDPFPSFLRICPQWRTFRRVLPPAGRIGRSHR